MKTVLVVEDDVDLRGMFRTALRLGGYDVLEAGDGLDALRLLDATDVHLIVLDLGLPLISGKTVLEEVAAHAHERRVPLVIVVTGSPGPYEALVGAECVLTKPVLPEQLIATVTHCIGSDAAAPSA